MATLFDDLEALFRHMGLPGFGDDHVWKKAEGTTYQRVGMHGIELVYVYGPMTARFLVGSPSVYVVTFVCPRGPTSTRTELHGISHTRIVPASATVCTHDAAREAAEAGDRS